MLRIRSFTKNKKFNEYFHKTKELQDLLADYIKSDKVSEKAKNISRRVLNNLEKI